MLTSLDNNTETLDFPKDLKWSFVISLVPVERFSVKWWSKCYVRGFTRRIKHRQLNKKKLKKKLAPAISSFKLKHFCFQTPMSVKHFLWLRFKENQPKMSYPSTHHASLWTDLCVDQAQTALVWRGKWEIPPHWAAPMPPTDVVISHWNLNQTINIRQLSYSEKQHCLHNNTCQDTLAGFTVCDSIGCFYCQTSSWKCSLKTSFYFNSVSKMQNLASKRLSNTQNAFTLQDHFLFCLDPGSTWGKSTSHQAKSRFIACGRTDHIVLINDKHEESMS